MGFISSLRLRRQRGALTREGKEHWRRGNQGQAIACYEKALEIDVALKGADSADVAEDYDNLGVAYKARGDLDRALEFMKKATAILESIAVRHVRLPSCYNHLGIVYRELNDCTRAVEYHEKALAIQEKTAGPLAGRVTQTTRILLEAARSRQAGSQTSEGAETDL